MRITRIKVNANENYYQYQVTMHQVGAVANENDSHIDVMHHSSATHKTFRYIPTITQSKPIDYIYAPCWCIYSR